MTSYSPLLHIMVQAVQRAARGLRRDFGELENLQVALKGPADFVSKADKKCEETLYYELLRARPHYGFLMEEGGVVIGSDTAYRWVIDPLDGTTNFLHGIPFFSISIALEKEDAIVAALVHNPITGEMFYAQKGGGAFLNEMRIRVGKRQHISQSVLAVTMPHMGHNVSVQETWGKLAACFTKKAVGMRCLGSTALELAFVAAGRFDGYIGQNISWWDMAAGSLLVTEAGGIVGTMQNKPLSQSTDILAGNPSIYNNLRQDIEKINLASEVK